MSVTPLDRIRTYKSLKWWVLLAALAITSAVWLHQYATQRRQAEERFVFEITRIQDAVRTQIERYETVLRFSRSFLAQRPDIPHELWMRYVQAIDLHGRYAGISTLSYVTRVPREAIPALAEGLARRDIGLLFSARPDKSVHYVKTHTEPLSEDWRTLGRDLSDDPNLRAAADRSVDSGRPTLTTFLEPLSGTEKGSDLALFYPIYDTGAPPDDLERRRASATGWVVARFDSARMVQEAMHPLPPDIHFEIFDGRLHDPQRLVFDSDARLVPPGGDPSASFSRTVVMEVGGRPWTLLFMTNATFDSSTLKHFDLVFLATGLILSLALFYAAALLTEARARALTRAAEMSRAYQESEERIHMIADSVPALISYIDRERRYRFANREYEDWFGRDSRDMVGRSVADVMGAATYVRLAPYVDKVLAGERVTFEEAVTAVDGEVRHLHATLVPHIHTGEIIGYFAFGEDDTQRRNFEMQRQALVADLERSNSELEQFAYVASHDLQEPLRMVSSYMQLIKRKYGDRLDGEAEEFIDYAVEGARRMQSMISDLLGYSRVGTRGRDLAPTPLAAPLRGALKNLEAAVAETGADIVVGALPVVMADDHQITRLLQNLIGNALKYRHPERAPQIRIAAERTGDMWRISIADNGIGIAAEHSDRIFLIFQRLHTHDKYEGTGIGLAVCKKIVERHGGRIWVEGRPGEGSTFFFTLRGEPDSPMAAIGAAEPVRLFDALE